MTETMLGQLALSLEEVKASWDGVFVAQGMKRPPMSRFTWFIERKNLGFAKGMNLSFQAGITRHAEPPSHVLCINNDVEMPNSDWLKLLLDVDDGHVLAPTTDSTATPAQQASGPETRDPVCVPVTPAIAWLMPWSKVEQLREKLGPNKLFDERFGMAWGEDGYNSAIWQQHDQTPFKVVPRSWIKHLGSRTSRHIPDADKMRSYHASVKAIREDLNPHA
jgi:hypothetical protein